VINHPALTRRGGPGEQALDLVYHAELGLDEHIETIYEENEMDPAPVREITAELDDSAAEAEIQGVSGAETAERRHLRTLREGDYRAAHRTRRREGRGALQGTRAGGLRSFLRRLRRLHRGTRPLRAVRRDREEAWWLTGSK
jgi:hypothetical protein